MVKIALVGEAPSDTKSIKNLLEKKYQNVIFFGLLENVRGGDLDNTKVKHFLRKEYETTKPNLVIFIRDLDSLESDSHQLKIRKKYFTEFNSVVDKTGLYLLNIYEIEALILADIDTFNKEYHTQIEPVANVMEVVEPKEYLKMRAKNYVENHNPQIFEQLDFEKILNCTYFKKFVVDLDEQVSNHL